MASLRSETERQASLRWSPSPELVPAKPNDTPKVKGSRGNLDVKAKGGQ